MQYLEVKYYLKLLINLTVSFFIFITVSSDMNSYYKIRVLLATIICYELEKKI